MLASRWSERGMSLIEALIATAVLAIGLIVALTVYDASRKAFAKGENATEQQESIRIAYDMLTSDIRMLGFNVNPDGDPARPDEQLEGALEHAIIFRGDFDQSDPGANQTPEASLAGGPFHNVSTGNDEIVAYVLSKPDGTGPDTIIFQADVKEPVRDGRVEPVSISNVVLNPTSPPYTLYRVTFNNDSSTYGGRERPEHELCLQRYGRRVQRRLRHDSRDPGGEGGAQWAHPGSCLVGGHDAPAGPELHGPG
jgi:type II secretory pathway pseudopilin PulG